MDKQAEELSFEALETISGQAEWSDNDEELMDGWTTR